MRCETMTTPAARSNTRRRSAVANNAANNASVPQPPANHVETATTHQAAAKATAHSVQPNQNASRPDDNSSRPSSRWVTRKAPKVLTVIVYPNAPVAPSSIGAAVRGTAAARVAAIGRAAARVTGDWVRATTRVAAWCALPTLTATATAATTAPSATFAQGQTIWTQQQRFILGGPRVWFDGRTRHGSGGVAASHVDRWCTRVGWPTLVTPAPAPTPTPAGAFFIRCAQRPTTWPGR